MKRLLLCFFCLFTATISRAQSQHVLQGYEGETLVTVYLPLDSVEIKEKDQIKLSFKAKNNAKNQDSISLTNEKGTAVIGMVYSDASGFHFMGSMTYNGNEDKLFSMSETGPTLGASQEGADSASSAGANEGSTNKSNYDNPIRIGILVGLACLIGAFLFWLLFIRGQDKLSPRLQSDISSFDNWRERVLPIVRIGINRKLFKGYPVLVVYNDAIGSGHLAKGASIGVLHNPNSKDQFLKSEELTNKRLILFDAVKRVRVEKESRMGKVQIKIYHDNKVETLVLAGFNTPHLVDAMKALLGDRVETEQSIRFSGYRVWVMTVFYLLLIVLTAFKLKDGYRIAGLVLAFFGGFFLILPGLANWIDDHSAREFSSSQVVKPKADLSRRKQLRSPVIGILLKGVAFAIFILTMYHSYIVKDDVSNILISLAMVYFVMGCLLNLSLAFSSRDPFKMAKKDTRKPILYLRSFLDDRETTLQPGTSLSSYLGVDPPYYQLTEHRFDYDSRLFRIRRDIIRYMYNHHLIRVVRMFAGRPVDTSEQQLDRYFSKKGPFVAIGKPGERLVTVGASRIYVSNDHWQGVVKDYLNKSQLVVLQPASTEGIWWEINQCLENIRPESLVMCLVDYKGQQDAYEKFRLRMEDLRPGISFPRHVGNEKTIYFFRFDSSWRPELLPLKYKSWILWPFLANAVDLDRTFAS